MAIHLLGQGKARGDIPSRLINACMDMHLGPDADRAAAAARMAETLIQSLARHGLTLAVTADIRTFSQSFFLPAIIQDNTATANANQNDGQKIGEAIRVFIDSAAERIVSDGLVLMQQTPRPPAAKAPGIDLLLALSIYAPGLSQQQTAVKKN